ncbi:hypothetical protein BC567DRAFT_250826 [Phyllosticta citribraziliensis]
MAQQYCFWRYGSLQTAACLKRHFPKCVETVVFAQSLLPPLFAHRPLANPAARYKASLHSAVRPQLPAPTRKVHAPRRRKTYRLHLAAKAQPQQQQQPSNAAQQADILILILISKSPRKANHSTKKSLFKTVVRVAPRQCYREDTVAGQRMGKPRGARPPQKAREREEEKVWLWARERRLKYWLAVGGLCPQALRFAVAMALNKSGDFFAPAPAHAAAVAGWLEAEEHSFILSYRGSAIIRSLSDKIVSSDSDAPDLIHRADGGHQIEHVDKDEFHPNANFRRIFDRLNAALDAVQEAGGQPAGKYGEGDLKATIFVAMPPGTTNPIDPEKEEWVDFIVTRIE